MRFPSFNPKDRQKGFATLFIVMMLALIMAVIALTTAQVGIMEQRITGNDLRAREAQEAAEAGLEYGVAWAGKNNIPWPTGTSDKLTCPATGCPTLPTITGSSSGEAYNISSLVYYRPNVTSDFIRVTSTSVGSPDATIIATAEAYVKPRGILSSNGKMPPPLVIDKCMTKTTGNPDIYPSWHDLDKDGVKDPNEWNDENGNGIVDAGEWTDANGNGKVDNEIGAAIITSQPEYVGGNFCLDYCGPGGGGCSPSSPGTGKPHLNLHDGVLQNNAAFPNNSIWNYYFDISQEQFKAIASTTLSTAPGLYWITSSGNWDNGTYGSATNPVIIVFENGCPKPNGTTVIYGILFFLAGCETDPMNGWGNVTVYGSVGINGGVDKLNSNPEIHGVGDDSVMPIINSFPIQASRLPGTWKDF